jgi:hypothetical protein
MRPPFANTDLRRQAPLAWAGMLALAGLATWLAAIGREGAAQGVWASFAGCLALILPPRERMRLLPGVLRRLPRHCDAAPVLASLLSGAGYGFDLFNRPGPYDEVVHLASGVLAGMVLVALLGRRKLALAAAGLALAVGWEAFEWLVGIIGTWRDTWTDVVLTASGVLAGMFTVSAPPSRSARARRCPRWGRA